MAEAQQYCACVRQQLDELELLSSIYCGVGELQLLDAGVVADLNEFLDASDANGKMLQCGHLEFIVAFTLNNGNGRDRLEVRVELPHLYPLLERPIVSVHTPLLDKTQAQELRLQIDNYIGELEQQQPELPYIYQLLCWLQDQVEAIITKQPTVQISKPSVAAATAAGNSSIDFERLWIYSHHIKSSAKRQELLRQARQLQLSGFSRPGKPGIICVEGERDNVQEFWRAIKSLRWQKITVVKSEQRQLTAGAQLQSLCRFDGFTEQLFNAVDATAGADEGVMNMGQFIKYLEAHGSGYMKSELFGLS